MLAEKFLDCGQCRYFWWTELGKPLFVQPLTSMNACGGFVLITIFSLLVLNPLNTFHCLFNYFFPNPNMLPILVFVFCLLVVPLVLTQYFFMFIFAAAVINFWLKYGRASFDWTCGLHKTHIFSPKEYRMLQILVNYINENSGLDRIWITHCLVYAWFVMGLYTLISAEKMTLGSLIVGGYAVFATVSTEWGAAFLFDVRNDCSLYRYRLIRANGSKLQKLNWRTLSMLPNLNVAVAGRFVEIRKGSVLTFIHAGVGDVLGFIV